MPEERGAGGVFSFIILFLFSWFVLWYIDMANPFTIMGVSIILLAMVRSFVPSTIVEFEEYERGVVFRFGAYNRVAGPGWVFILPFVERYFTVDLRVSTADITPQTVVTKDNVELSLDAIIYMRVTDPAKAVINVHDYEDAAINYTRAHLRDVVGRLTMAEVISRINYLNDLLRKGLEEIARDWGVEVVKVEIQSVQLPRTLVEAMLQKKSAEQIRMASEERAKAKEIMINAIERSAGKLSDPSIAYLYLESLKRVADGRASKIIFPMELGKLAESLTKKLSLKEGVKAPDYERVAEDLVKQYKEIYSKYASRIREKESEAREGRKKLLIDVEHEGKKSPLFEPERVPKLKKLRRFKPDEEEEKS